MKKISPNRALALWAECGCECPHSRTAAVQELTGMRPVKRRRSRWIQPRRTPRQRFMPSCEGKESSAFTREEMLTLRGLCLQRGYTLCHWLRRQRTDFRNAYTELRGVRNHPKAQRFRAMVREEFAI